jgi:predicted RND superfamily exporter protein
MKRRMVLILAGLAIILLVGFWRLHIDVDVFNLLPTDSRMVEGLKLYQQSFGTSRELIISLRSPDASRTKHAARSLAEALGHSQLTTRVVWHSPFQEDPAALGEFLAYLWFNQPSANYAQLTHKLQKDQLHLTLTNTLERMATSMRPQEIARLSYDPFALTDLPASITSSQAPWAKDPFASPDGSFRILFVTAPDETAGFLKYRRWVAQMTDFVSAWKQKNGIDDSLTVRITGTPAFVSETGSGLMRDMQFAALGTLVLIAGLFWLVYRDAIPLLWLLTLLIFVVLITVALGALFLGTLNGVSLGFAAILLGLATDYGLILYQEFVVDPHRSLEEHHAVVAPSILWSAITTAGAFLMISRSSLPGLAQLGILVSIGILVAAAVMLLAFLPPLLRRVRPLTKLIIKDHTKEGPALMLRSKTAWCVTLLTAGVSICMLLIRLPGIDYSTSKLGPRKNQSMAALEEIRHAIGGFDDILVVIISGTNDREVVDRMKATDKVLDKSLKDGLLASYTLPEMLWPNPDTQAANRANARWMVSRLPVARDAARAAGFTEQSLQLTDQIFAAWKRFAATDGVVRPSHPGSQWVFRQFSAKASGRLLVMGRLEASTTTKQAQLLDLAERIDSATGSRMLGWSLLSESLMGIMKHDVKQVLIPIGVVVIIFLSLAFRKFGEIALSIATLGFSLLCLMALMSLLGWSWNLMNVMALPLLFGAGVDYSIHIQFALRRYYGDRSRVRKTVGRAVLLCCASTASGFGTLGFANNAGCASLGRVCATGIIITGLVSVFLLPVWWQTIKAKQAQ